MNEDCILTELTKAKSIMHSIVFTTVSYKFSILPPCLVLMARSLLHLVYLGRARKPARHRVCRQTIRLSGSQVR